MRRSFIVTCFGITALAAGLTACGDNLAPAQVDAGAQHDAVAEDGPTGTVSVYVVTGLQLAAWTGVAGADVVIDKPGGGREEKQTGSDGRVTFTGLDFALGKAAVTAYKAGSGLPPTSQVGITAESGEIMLFLWAFDYEKPTVTISGTAQNLHAASDRLWVTATNSLGYSDGVGPAWSFGVYPDVPFTLVAVDYTAVGVGSRGYTRTFHSWVALEHAAVTAATAVDLDLAPSATIKQVSGTMVLPTRAESRLRTHGQGHVYVQPWETMSGAGLGILSKSLVSADGTRIEYTIDWIEPASVQRPITQYTLFPPGTSSESSFVIRGGYPMGGELDATFIDIPEITAAPDPTAGQDLHGEIAWQVFDPDVWMRCFVNRGLNVAWMVVAPPTETSLRIPRGPSSLDEAALLGDEMREAFCQAMEWDLTSDWVERGATTATFLVARL
jgi:hypothetical protein